MNIPDEHTNAVCIHMTLTGARSMPDGSCVVCYVAQKAHETFLAKKQARKTMPQRTIADRQQLQDVLMALDKQWWDEVRPYMRCDR